jgi:hypothetical protein
MELMHGGMGFIQPEELISTQTRKAVGGGSRAAEVTSSAEARSAGNSKPSTKAY